MPSKRSKKNEQVRGKHAKHAAKPSAQSQPMRPPAQSKQAQQVTRPRPAQSSTAAVQNTASPAPTQQVPTAPAQQAANKRAAEVQAQATHATSSESAHSVTVESQHKVVSGYPERAKTPAIPPAQGKASKRSKRKNAKQKKQRRVPLAVKIILLVTLVAALAVGAFLVWNHLFRYDDAQDIQGQWKIEGSNNSIVITEDEIRLTDSVSFEYELNTFEKTITYQFVNYTGEGRYVFSPERDVLTLTDISPEPDEGDTQESMRLLKVSNQAIGEPESANNNDVADANSTGAEVVDGSLSAQQAEKDSDATSN